MSLIVIELYMQGTIAWALRHHNPFNSLFTVIALVVGVDGVDLLF